MTRRCLSTDKPMIDRLRVAEYLKAPQFIVNTPSALEWDASDDQHVVLACLDGDVAVATMRGFVAADEAQMRFCMEAELPDLQVEYPCLILTKAATRQGEQGLWLNSLLRYFFLDAAARRGVRTLAGAVFAGSPRVILMRELGYRFVETGRVTYPCSPRSPTAPSRCSTSRCSDPRPPDSRNLSRGLRSDIHGAEPSWNSHLRMMGCDRERRQLGLIPSVCVGRSNRHRRRRFSRHAGAAGRQVVYRAGVP